MLSKPHQGDESLLGAIESLHLKYSTFFAGLYSVDVNMINEFLKIILLYNFHKINILCLRLPR